VTIGWGSNALGWGGLAVPAGTPDDVVATLRDVFSEVVQSDELETALGDLAPMLGYQSPEDTAVLWESSFETLRPHVEAILRSN